MQASGPPAISKGLSVEDLSRLAAEIRSVILERVSCSGGHLTPNLGAVELTLALHRVFDFAHDRLLFDVGHQCYTHKLVTGRGEPFGRLRQRDGVSGFPEPLESEYDLFSVGHAGTAIATAAGLARGDQVRGEGDRRVVALVGDASIVNGVALEGLNGAGTLERQFLVVLNDNGMAIAEPQGALARTFANMGISRGSGNGGIKCTDHVFRSFGFRCIGPIDGHDLGELLEVLGELRDCRRPVLLHCKTVKGKGFDFSAGDPTAFHSPKPFRVEGRRVVVGAGGHSFSAAFGDALADVMRDDPDIFAVTAAMPDGTGLDRVASEFPDRTLDAGLCESNAMDVCAGMARSGLKPFFAVYSTFVQRALDQVFQEVALQGLPVRVCLDRAGFVGGDGAVHHGFMDVSLFRPLAGTVLLAASDEPSLRAALEFMRSHGEGASFLRYPRGDVPEPPLAKEVAPFELGRAVLVRGARVHPASLAILAYGTEVYEAHRALGELGELGELASRVALFDARFAKPVDVGLVRDLIEAGTSILTVEEHARTGGFGTAVLEAANDAGLPTDGIHRLGMAEAWTRQAGRPAQLAEAGLDASGIAAGAREILTARFGSPEETFRKNGSRRRPKAHGTIPTPGFEATSRKLA